MIIRNFAPERNFFWPQRASCPLGAQPEWLCSDKTMSARLSDYDYDLPQELIAQRPLQRREDSRMMVLHRAAQTIEQRQFRELKMFLQPGDLLVLNDTWVLPARRFSDDGAIEFLFLERLGPKHWKCLVRPGRKMRVGATEKIAEHRMHAECFSISPEAARQISNAHRIVAVGTTTVRTLESASRADGEVLAREGATSLFIYPPYDFRAVDVLLTNFHLPRSTLLMLVSAFAGREFLLRAYEEAIRERYRFYSYGDCMLIL